MSGSPSPNGQQQFFEQTQYLGPQTIAFDGKLNETSQSQIKDIGSTKTLCAFYNNLQSNS